MYPSISTLLCLDKTETFDAAELGDPMSISKRNQNLGICATSEFFTELLSVQL